MAEQQIFHYLLDTEIEDRIKASEDERWYSQDYRRYLSEDDPFYVNAMKKHKYLWLVPT